MDENTTIANYVNAQGGTATLEKISEATGIPVRRVQFCCNGGGLGLKVSGNVVTKSND